MEAYIKVHACGDKSDSATEEHAACTQPPAAGATTSRPVLSRRQSETQKYIAYWRNRHVCLGQDIKITMFNYAMQFMKNNT